MAKRNMLRPLNHTRRFVIILMALLSKYQFMRLTPLYTFLLPAFIWQSCELKSSNNTHPSFANLTAPGDFAEYWYQSKAEISSYDLEIMRYGELRRGDAVMIFVTEDFSASKQVKLDHPEEEGEDKAPVMKLNSVWKFKTGIYDYSLMYSLFTPIDIGRYPNSLKLTCSVQDWCGHAFSQLNREKNGYQVRQYSYFETEGDRSYKVKPDMLEDELFTRIRINPGSIPLGEADLIPSGFYARLAHEAIKPKRARIQFLESEATTQCLVEYLHLDRTLRIHFETAFPHRIISWSEEENREVVVSGKLRKTIQSPYWEENATQFLPLRDTLQLTY